MKFQTSFSLSSSLASTKKKRYLVLCTTCVCSYFCLMFSYIISICITLFVQDFLFRPWMLGEQVMMNSTVILQQFLPKMFRSRNLKVDDYSTIVATIWLNSAEDKHVVCVSPSTFRFLYEIKLCFCTQNSLYNNADTYDLGGLQMVLPAHQSLVRLQVLVPLFMKIMVLSKG